MNNYVVMAEGRRRRGYGAGRKPPERARALYAYIQAHPGAGRAEIMRALGWKVADLYGALVSAESNGFYLCEDAGCYTAMETGEEP